jgi:pilus assembly protein Flp/PilA
MSWNVSRRREHGQGLAEYALILALIAVFVIGALTLMGDGVVATMNTVSQAL